MIQIQLYIIIQIKCQPFYFSSHYIINMNKKKVDAKKQFANYILEAGEMAARNFPPQMRDLIISWNSNEFIGTTVALMILPE